MNVEDKKTQILEDIAAQPQNIVFSRIELADQLQLIELMKTSTIQDLILEHSGQTLHEICMSLAQQRAIISGAGINDVLHFNYDKTAYGAIDSLSFPTLSTMGYSIMHDLNDSGGGIITLSITPDETIIINGTIENKEYYTDYTKYFLTKSRSTNELISIDADSDPYMSPTELTPFIPANTINGETYVGNAPDPTTNDDIRYDFSLGINNSFSGQIGKGYDLLESYYTGYMYVEIDLIELTGVFNINDKIQDSKLNTGIVTSFIDKSKTLISTSDTNGTFIANEIVTNNTVESIVSSVDTGIITTTGIDVIFDVSNMLLLDTNSIQRIGNKVTISYVGHGVKNGDKIVIKGADADYEEFNDVFDVIDVTDNTIIFDTTLNGNVNPTGNIIVYTNILFGKTSNAICIVERIELKNQATVTFEMDTLTLGFVISDKIKNIANMKGTIETRKILGNWVQQRNLEVKNFNGSWDIDSAANALDFWNAKYEPVNIESITFDSGSGSGTTIGQITLDQTLSKEPQLSLSYPLKTWEDQFSISAYENFANVVCSVEGFNLDYSWNALTSNIYDCTEMSKSAFESKLGNYANPNPPDDIYKAANLDNRSNSLEVNATYPNVNINPFYPEVVGTHKANSNSDDGITGTQPGTLTDKDIYAGFYQSHIPTDTNFPYHYAIYNNLKWSYDINPFAAGYTEDVVGVSDTTGYYRPRTTPFPSTYSGSQNQILMDAINEVGITFSEIVDVPAGVTTAPSMGSQTNVHYSYDSASKLIMQNTDVYTWVAPAYTAPNPSSSTAEFVCLHNRLTHWLDSTTFIHYKTLLQTLQTSHAYIDPLEPTTPVHISDASFNTAITNALNAISSIETRHTTEHNALVLHAWPAAYTSSGNYVSDINAQKPTLSTTKTSLDDRVLEIGNRIGLATGTGHANKLYKIANFLAGKRTKLFINILGMITDISYLYTQITDKRSEYEEYNI